jgi:hypothetical protein
MNNIAIFGDSFSDPSLPVNNYSAWPELLSNNFSITNYSKHGSSLWWAYEQFKQHKDSYDYCIFTITLPGRLFLKSLNQHITFAESGWPMAHGINLGKTWFKYFYDKEREEVFHNFIVDDILKTPNTLVVPAFAESVHAYSGWTLCHLSDLERNHYKRPTISPDEKRKCHLTKENNLVVYNKILSALDNKDLLLTLTEADYVVPKDPAHFYWF